MRTVYGKSAVIRKDGPKRAARQVAVAGLASRGAAETAGLTDRVRREVVVQHKAPLDLALFDIVHILLVHFRAERRGDDRLRLTAGEQRRAVDPRQPADLALDRTDLGEFTSIGTAAVAEHILAEDLFLELAEKPCPPSRGLPGSSSG